MGIGFMAYMTFIFTMQLPWAFRGDIDHIDSLKTLPVAPLALATGELAGGIAVAGGDPVRRAGGPARHGCEPSRDHGRRGFPASLRRRCCSA